MSKVLFATIMGGYEQATTLEKLLARKLESQGHEVMYLLCDSTLPACQMMKLSRTPSHTLKPSELSFNYCRDCVSTGKKEFAEFESRVLHLSQFMSSEDFRMARDLSGSIPFDSLKQYMFEDVRVGMHAYAGAIRYFAKRTIENENDFEIVIRKYLEASILATIGMKAIFEKFQFDSLVINHGIYVPQGPIAEFARKKSHVITWNPSYRESTFIFSHHESYHFSMVTEDVTTWADQELTECQRQNVLGYLKSRELGTGDWIKFSDTNSGINHEMRFVKPVGYEAVYLALTSVVWDAELHYDSRAFDSMFDWLEETIKFFALRPHLCLILRVHPAEILAPTKSREPVKQFLISRFPDLPNNIVVLDSDSVQNTFSIMDACDFVLIYNTKAGIEAACRGKTVVVAGEAWIRNKGFSIDVTDSEQYPQILESLLKNETVVDTERALRYAYHFYFKRMIKLDYNLDKNTTERESKSSFQLKKELDENLEAVSRSILNAEEPFHAIH